MSAGDDKGGPKPAPPAKRVRKATIQTGAAKAGVQKPPAPPASAGDKLPPPPPKKAAQGGKVPPPKVPPKAPGAGKPAAKPGAPPPKPPPGRAGAPRPAAGKPAAGAPRPPAASKPTAGKPAPKPAAASKPGPKPPAKGSLSAPDYARPTPAQPMEAQQAASKMKGETRAKAPQPPRPPQAKQEPEAPAPTATEDKPTLLVVGKLGPIESALRTALVQRGMLVETATKEDAVTVAFAAAPDLILLAGDAAKEEGGDVLELLAKNPSTSVLPVILLADDPSLQRRIEAFRHGAVAVVPRSASVDEMARRITDLSKEVHDRPGQKGGELGEASVDELVDLLSKEVRSGILSVRAGSGGEQTQARFVVRAGRPVQQAIEQFVNRLRPLVKETEQPLRYEFEESTVARLDMLDGATEAEPTHHDALQGRRVLLVHNNPAAADVLAQELRARGATVVVSDGEGTALDRARDLDPDVVLVDAEGMDTWAYRVMSQLRRDTSLRWASMLLVHWNEVWAEGAPTPNVDRLAAGIEPLIEPDRTLANRAREEASFDTRLEVLGPGRTLRALAESGQTLHATVRNPRAMIEVDVAEGLVAGARCQKTDDGSTVEGPAALAALLGLGSGRVRVEQREVPSTATIMAPVPTALHAAQEETPPVKPSLPPEARLEAHSTDFDVDLDAPTRVTDSLLEEHSSPSQPSQPSQPSTAGAGDVLGEAQASLDQAQASGTAATVPAELVSELRSLVHELRATRQSSSGAVAAPSPPAPPEPPAPPAPPASPPAEAQPTPPEPPPATAEAGRAPRVTPAQATAETVAVEEPPERRSTPWGKILLVAALVLGVAAGGAAAFLMGGDEGPFASKEAASPPEGTGAAGAAPPGAASGTGEATAGAEGADDGTGGEDPEGEEADPAVAAGANDAGTGEAEQAAAVDAGAGAGADAGAEGTEGAEADQAEGEEGAEKAAAGEEPGAEATGEEADVAAEEEAEAEEEPEPEKPRRKMSRKERIADRLVQRGNRFRRQHSHWRAIAEYKKVLRMEPRNARATAGLVRSYMALHKDWAAVKYAKRLVLVAPKTASNHVLLGDALYKAGSKSGARASYRRALRIDPDNRTARRRLRRL